MPALNYIRLGASVLLTGITVLGTYYPGNAWIAAVTAGLGVIGIYAVPAAQQIQMKGHAMTTPTGSELMGITKPRQAAETPETPPDTTGTQDHATVTEQTPEPPAEQPAAPGTDSMSHVRQALADAANILLQAASKL